MRRLNARMNMDISLTIIQGNHKSIVVTMFRIHHRIVYNYKVYELFFAFRCIRKGLLEGAGPGDWSNCWVVRVRCRAECVSCLGEYNLETHNIL